MKLSDIEKTNSYALNKKMREKLGWNLNLGAMTAESANSMMESIDQKLATVRSSHKLHESQNNPNYVGLIMAKKILESYVAEAELKVKETGQKPDYIDIDGDGDKSESMKKAAQDKKKKPNFAKKGESVKEAKAPMQGKDKKAMVSKKKVAESFNRRLMEDELGQAQAMLAAKDMVDSMQDMIEDLSKMLNEQLPPLTDSIRTAIGSGEADSFKASASSTLSSLLTTVQSSREAMDQAVRALSGEPSTVAVPGAGGEEPSLGGDLPDLGDDMSGEEDDFAASDAAVGGELPLGREKR